MRSAAGDRLYRPLMPGPLARRRRRDTKLAIFQVVVPLVALTVILLLLLAAQSSEFPRVPLNAFAYNRAVPNPAERHVSDFPYIVADEWLEAKSLSDQVFGNGTAFVGDAGSGWVRGGPRVEYARHKTSFMCDIVSTSGGFSSVMGNKCDAKSTSCTVKSSLPPAPGPPYTSPFNKACGSDDTGGELANMASALSMFLLYSAPQRDVRAR